MALGDRRYGIVRGTALAAGALVGVTSLIAPADPDAPSTQQGYPYALAAFAPLPTPASRVLTLEGGFVGLQNLAYFTPQQLRGDLCKKPNTCQPVDYPALPGNDYDEAAAVNVENAIAALPENERIILFGHSQGGEVIYSNLLRWKEDPDTAPDPSRVTWVSIGNPENALGGVTTKFPFPTKPAPVDTKYAGIEVIHQYDGWADAPDNPFNLLAVLNAVIGSQSYHLNYWDVDLNDPNNVVFTPDQPDGTPGNVTYVYVPAKVIPLVKDTGFLAPILDQWLRPIVEAGYNRPVEIPSPNAPKAQPGSAELPTSLLSAEPMGTGLGFSSNAAAAVDPAPMPEIPEGPAERPITVVSGPVSEVPMSAATSVIGANREVLVAPEPMIADESEPVADIAEPIDVPEPVSEPVSEPEMSEPEPEITDPIDVPKPSSEPDPEPVSETVSKTDSDVSAGDVRSDRSEPRESTRSSNTRRSSSDR
jgi:hypothetical protein